jgi:hypothetical protein
MWRGADYAPPGGIFANPPIFTIRCARSGTPVSLPAVQPAVPAAAIAIGKKGQICVLAFVDEDGNGMRSNDEPPVAGAKFYVFNMQGSILTSHISTGSAEPYCFENLTAGSYTVDGRPPPNMVATSDTRWGAPLTNGSTVNVIFGSRPAANGQICVQAFDDKDGNGERSKATEPLLANVTFILSNETGRLGSYTTNGTEDNAYCFRNLAVGQYTVQARPDVNKIKGQATTPGQWVVPLASGAQYDVAYGVQVSGGGSSTTPVPTTGNKCIDENYAYFKDLGVIYFKDWYDLQKLEAEASGSQKASIIARMQDLRRRAASLTPTACAKTHHDLFIAYLDKTINYYILAANGADMTVQLQAAKEAADALHAFTYYNVQNTAP